MVKRTCFLLANLCLLFISTVAMAQQQNTETGAVNQWMREDGKINVVVSVLVIIFLGIVLYLYRLDRKLKKLEDEQQQSK
ncbi:CcmD family protein [Chitinophaga skermanii]|uniref:CcmD family protein n=1 Tax=Chitinophaga skermanii TaxID=331697 RepID=A0A327Q837_9BACT|nr:CcmD family protein [Chitinophaga skermanii]RAI99871.1 CcmD family protein [Chitinophaga skermanii]